MSSDNISNGFEYKNKGDETPFETFLRYTDEKEKSSTYARCNTPLLILRLVTVRG
ncbi:MAG: hypothetical protein JWP06_575 [Candidatus Saccharibacteria bacterium]|nr:hypothetical protein [Candidatus Saccharibacteria bacterium]